LEINPSWLVEIAPHYYKEKEITEGGEKKALPKKVGRSNMA